MAGEQIDIRLGEIIADDAHQLHRRKETGGERYVRGRAAQHAVDLPMRCLHAIVRDGTYYD